MELNFRKLYVSELEARIGNISKTGSGLSLLLYKDARVDQRLLDETAGPMNWEKSYRRDEKGRLFCKVSIWDREKGQFVSKEDVGVESYSEKEKGEASDSFKRACFCWGIGRELYSAPFLWVNSQNCNIREYEGKYTCSDRFDVIDIEYGDNCNVTYVEIYNRNKKVTLSFGKKSSSGSFGKAASKQTEAISLFDDASVEDYSINPDEAAAPSNDSTKENPGMHKISFECSRKGQTIADIYAKEGAKFLQGILTYATAKPAMQVDAPYVKAFLETVA